MVSLTKSFHYLLQYVRGGGCLENISNFTRAILIFSTYSMKYILYSPKKVNILYVFHESFFCSSYSTNRTFDYSRHLTKIMHMWKAAAFTTILGELGVRFKELL